MQKKIARTNDNLLHIGNNGCELKLNKFHPLQMS